MSYAVSSSVVYYLQGTHQYMSCRLIQFPTKLHQLQDDLESFVHVVMYTVLRYHHTGLAAGSLGNMLHDCYNYKYSHYAKAAILQSPKIFEGEELHFPGPLALWVTEACQMAAEWLGCDNSKVKKIPDLGDAAKLVVALVIDPRVVVNPSTKFSSHKALSDMWLAVLKDPAWVTVPDEAAQDLVPETSQKSHAYSSRTQTSRSHTLASRSGAPGGSEVSGNAGSSSSNLARGANARVQSTLRATAQSSRSADAHSHSDQSVPQTRSVTKKRGRDPDVTSVDSNASKKSRTTQRK